MRHWSNFHDCQTSGDTSRPVGRIRLTTDFVARFAVASASEGRPGWFKRSALADASQQLDSRDNLLDEPYVSIPIASSADSARMLRLRRNGRASAVQSLSIDLDAARRDVHSVRGGPTHPGRTSSRMAQTTTRPGICRICSAHCGVLATVSDGKLIKVTGDPDNPMFKGYTCSKGRALPEIHNSARRLLHSQKRRPDGTYARIDANRAMDEIAAKLRI